MPFLPPSSTQVTIIEDGPSGITTVVNAATAPGTTASFKFTVNPFEARNIYIDYVAQGTYTVATVQLQESLDGGTTFRNRGAAIDMAATPVGSIGPLARGAQYLFSVATFTGTSITVNIASA